MLYNPVISPSWIISKTAQRVYFACSLSVVYLIGVWFASMFAMILAGAGAFPPLIASGVRMLLFPGVLGFAILWIAMWYYWYSFDHSSTAARTLSFVILCFGPLGAFLYYIAFYRRLVRSTLARTTAASAS